MKTTGTSFCNHLYYITRTPSYLQTYSELCFPYSCSASDFSLDARMNATSMILSSLPNEFPRLLREVMHLQGVSIRELCDRIPISEHTISTLRTKPRSSYSLSQIVTLVVGLRLPPFLSRKLIERAGICLDGNPHSIRWMCIVDTMFMLPYDNIQDQITDI